MRLIYGVHVVWHYLILEPSTTFSQVLWSMLWPHYQMWLITSNPNPKVLKIEKWKINWNKNKNEKENKKELSPLSVVLILVLYTGIYYRRCLRFQWYNHYCVRVKNDGLSLFYFFFLFFIIFYCWPKVKKTKTWHCYSHTSHMITWHNETM